MKQIINNRKYDTDTALIVASKEKPAKTDKGMFKKETIYLKTTGEYFLLSEFTSHGEKCYSHIFPLSGIDDAKQWANKNMSVDDYEATFGPVPE